MYRNSRKKKIKIAVFADNFYPLSMAIAIRIRHLVDALIDSEKFDVSIGTSTEIENYRSIGIRKNLIPAPSNESKNFVRLFNELLLGFELFIRILFIRADLIFLTSPPFFACYICSLAARLRRIDYIIDVRDYYPEVFFSTGLIQKGSFTGKFLKYLEKKVYDHALMISAATKGIYDKIQNHGQYNNRLVLFRNGYDDKLFFPSKTKNQRFTVVFHGNLGKFQRSDLIYELAKYCLANHPDIDFKIIGWGNNDDIFKTNKLENLEYLGKVEHQAIPKILSKAHLGISLRTDDLISIDSFPVKIYEYIGAGLPVIVTPISEAGTFVETNGIGFQFKPSELSLIYKKLIDLYKNHNLLHEYSNNCLKVRDQFSRKFLSEEFVKKIIERDRNHA